MSDRPRGPERPPPASATDAEGELLRRHREGEPDAFAELVARYRLPIYAYLCRCGILDGERDDLFQEVFLRVHRAAGHYDDDQPFHPWLFTIVANAVRNHHRQRRVRELVFARVAAPERDDPSPDGERIAESREDARRLVSALRRLPLKQRQLLLLVAVEGLSLKQAGIALELPLNTVKSTLRRTRQRLGRALRRQSEERDP